MVLIKKSLPFPQWKNGCPSPPTPLRAHPFVFSERIWRAIPPVSSVGASDLFPILLGSRSLSLFPPNWRGPTNPFPFLELRKGRVDVPFSSRAFAFSFFLPLVSLAGHRRGTAFFLFHKLFFSLCAPFSPSFSLSSQSISWKAVPSLGTRMSSPPFPYI